MLGTFFADPSTVNNDPSNYKTDVTQPAPWQAPNGLHRFMFVDVKVNSAVDEHGEFLEQDPLLGAKVVSTDKPTPAKIVDLDVYQQSVPMIYGLSLQINVADEVTLTGTLDPCAANGLRFSRVLPTRGWQDWDGYGAGSFGGDTYACAIYQSVLRVAPDDWPAATTGVLAQLRAATATDADGNILVAIRMVLDDYQNVPWHDDFSHGRVLATLGPASADTDTASVVGGRWLEPRPVDKKSNPADPWYWPDFYGAPAVFVEHAPDKKRLVIDLANAMALERPGGTPVPTGELSVILGDGEPDSLWSFQATQDLYQNLGGIIELPVTEAQWAARDQPLQIKTTREDIGGPFLWSEAVDGLHIEAADRVFRLQGHPGPPASALVRINQWGAPATGFQPAVIVVPVVEGIQAATVPPPGHYPGDTAQADGALSASITSVDELGIATVTLQVNADPGSRTQQLDGQLYFLVVYDPAKGVPDLMNVVPPQEAMISCVVFSAYSAEPTWQAVRTLMEPYAKLYPGMTDQIDLTQEQAFFTFALNPPFFELAGPGVKPYKLPDGRTIQTGAIPFVMTRDINDPQFMPVTRDLSTDKTLMILNYIADIQGPVKPTPPPPGTPTGGGS